MRLKKFLAFSIELIYELDHLLATFYQIMKIRLTCSLFLIIVLCNYCECKGGGGRGGGGRGSGGRGSSGKSGSVFSGWFSGSPGKTTGSHATSGHGGF